MSRRDEFNNTGEGNGLSPMRLGFYAGLAALSLGAGFLAAFLIKGAEEAREGNPPQAETRTAYSNVGKLIRRSEPQPVPDLAFQDADGKLRHLSEWRGKVVLLNLWATWCAPCKAEMPSLDRLQAKLGGDAFAVLAISQDRTGLDKPASFFAQEGIKHLALYNDSASAAIAGLKASGLPLSVILDRQGMEIARQLGPAEWDSPGIAGEIQKIAATSAARG
jgi:thiol-disulfide isomerase/thioredoxin